MVLGVVLSWEQAGFLTVRFEHYFVAGWNEGKGLFYAGEGAKLKMSDT